MPSLEREHCSFEGKVCYTKKDAQGQLHWFKSVRHRHGIRKKIPQRCYYCEHCGFWHLTSRRHKNGMNKPFDLNRFDEWFEATYQPVNCGNVPIPKVITFKEHIRILKERDNQYALLLNEYNNLVESFNKLQKAYCDLTGERYIE